MARIKITVPKLEALYITQIPLLINFINYGNHMGNDAILTLCQEARLRFLKSLGFSEMDFFGKSFIQGDAAICFKNEAFHGDELEFNLYIDDITSHGFDFIYEIVGSNKEIISIAKTGMVFFNYETRSIEKCPDDFLATYDK